MNPTEIEAQVSIPADKLENFERALRSNSSGCRRTCECGKEFYDNSDNHWDWGEGELERLLADPAARPLQYSVSTIIFEGKEYVADCDCWHKRAKQIMDFIDSHATAIANYLNLEKKRKQRIADEAPTVEEKP